jgi:hypothetical protein
LGQDATGGQDRLALFGVRWDTNIQRGRRTPSGLALLH